MFKIVFDNGVVEYADNHLDAVLAMGKGMANAKDAVIWKQQNDGSWKFVVATTDAFKKGMIV